MRAGLRPHPYRSRLRADSTFWFELSFCNDHGIPHSFYLGSKRLRWTPEDRAKALVFLQEKAMRCTMCGTADWEWDPAQGGKRRAYEPIEKFCHGCYARASGQKHDPNRNMDGITIELAPTGTIESARRLEKQRQRASRGAL